MNNNLVVYGSVRRAVAVLLAAMLLNACATPQTHKANQQSDLKPAPGITELTIESAGSRMSGLMYTAAGPGPHPTVILLHGYPGNEKNLDLAQALRRSGWNVLFFHYRGAWGSEGQFSFTGAEQDVQAVFNYLQDPKHRKRLRVEPTQISTVGHSMGGHMAIAGLLDNPAVRCAVALDGANMGAQGGLGLFKDPRVGKLWRDYSDTLFMLNGWSGDKAVAEMESNGRNLDLVPRAHAVADRPVLLLAADTDVVPMETHIEPLYEALSAAKNSGSQVGKHSTTLPSGDSEKRIQLTVIKDDHSFSASRLEMIAEVGSFLNAHCR